MIILTDKPGQLCNRLWSYAPFIAHSLKSGNRLVVPLFGDYAHLFENLNRNPLIRFIKVNNQHYFRGLHLIFKLCRGLPNPLLLKLNIYVDTDKWGNETWSREVLFGKHNIVFSSGWGQPNLDDILLDYREQIKAIFEPRLEYTARTRSFWRSRRNTYDVIVGVHIRRGDYKRFRGGAYYYDHQAYANYVQQLILDPQFSGRRIGFFFCSNEPIDYSRSSGVEVFHLPKARNVEDLYALSLCDYIIGPPSTFSMWASFCGQVPLRILRYSAEQIDVKQFSPIVAQNKFANGSFFEHIQSDEF